MQPTGSGINRNFFQYSTLGANVTPTTDGAIGNPIYVPQNTSAAQLAEWSDYTNFSAFQVASSIDNVVGNSAVELGYRAGQSLSELYSTFFDALVNVDSAVNATGTPGVTPLDLPTVRTLKEELVSINVMPVHTEGEYVGAISPNVVNDILNGQSVNASLIDWAKYDKERAKDFERIASGDQLVPIRLQTTGVCFYQTPFVTKTPSFSGGKTAYRTYIAGDYAAVGVWLPVPGDTDMGESDWRDISCKVVKSLPDSSYDPTGTIGALASYRFHQTITGRPVTGTNTQSLRYIDSVPAIQ
jgi:hypothetical protein